MHELSLAQCLIEQIQTAAEAENAIRVVRIVVAIGPFSGVDKASFEFAFPFAAEGTLADGAQLEIKEAPAIIECRACTTTSNPEPPRPICPHCGSDQVEIKGGHDFLIREIELEVG